MIDNNFYVSLPSNASFNEFPNNKQSNYTTVLESPIEFPSKYMVCLKEISNFSDFNVSMGTISFQNLLFTALEHRTDEIEFKLYLKNGLDLQQLCDTINTEITKHFLKQEYLIRYKLAYSNELSRQCSDLNFRKKDKKRPKFNLIKKIQKNEELFELIDSVSSFFSDSFKKCGGIFDKDRYVFKNLSLLNEKYDLIITTAPKLEDLEKEYNKNFFYQDRIEFFNQNTFMIAKPKSLKRSLSLENFESKIIKKRSNSLENISHSKRSLDKIQKEDLIRYPLIPTFKYVGANRIELDSSNTKIQIKGLLANFLNNSKINTLKLDSKESFYLPTKIQPTKFIVIYTDIIESQYYGNIKSPILRTVNIKSENDENTVFFDNPHYLNLNRTRIETINIQICDLTGELIQFRDNFSSIHMTLHFKRKE